MAIVKWLVGALAAAGFATCVAARGPAAAGPDMQPKIEAIIADAAQRYQGAPNAMAQGPVRAKRAHDLCIILKPLRGEVTGWTGTVDSLDSTAQGKGILAVRLNDQIVLATRVTDLFGDDPPTLIPPNSKLFAAASALSEGQKVTFGGHFLPSVPDCMEELSMTTTGDMTEPKFLFDFTAIAPAP